MLAAPCTGPPQPDRPVRIRANRLVRGGERCRPPRVRFRDAVDLGALASTRSFVSTRSEIWKRCAVRGGTVRGARRNPLPSRSVRRYPASEERRARSIWAMPIRANERGLQMNTIARKRILWIAVVASLVILPSAGTAWAKSRKAYVCHRGHTISVGKRAVRAHLKHGDSLGRCNSCADGCTATFEPVFCSDGKTVRQRMPGGLRRCERVRPGLRVRPDLRSGVLLGRQAVRQRVPGRVRRCERM